MKTKSYLEWIDKYNSGELNSEERRKFETQLKSDKKLNELYEFSGDLLTVIENEDLFKAKSVIQQIYEKEQDKKPCKYPGRNKLLYIAAGFVLLAGIIAILYFTVFSKATPGQLFNKYYTHPEIWEEYRSNSKNHPSSMYIQAAYCYKERDFNKANQLFTRYLQSNPVDAKALFAYGISLLNTNQSEKAIGQFKSVIKTQNNDFMQPAQWYLALTFLKMGETKKAEKILNEIARTNHYKSNEAGIILRRLK